MRQKYNAKRTTRNGYNFDSLLEADRFQQLTLAEKAGEIADLTVHPTFELQPAFTDQTGKKHRAIIYEADFYYLDTATDRFIIEDVKGYTTDLFRLKLKLFLYRYRDADLRIIK